MAQTASHTAPEEGTRRDFLELVAWSSVGVGAFSLALPLISSMNPSADVLALSSTEVDISGVEVGMGITVTWRGKPVFIRHRTAEEIAEAENTDLGDLPDPQADSDRVVKPEWLVMVGVCTHLGCVPLGTKSSEQRGDYDGWFCPCHGSHYDTAGRIRKGPAPENLHVPEYKYLSDAKIQIG